MKKKYISSYKQSLFRAVMLEKVIQMRPSQVQSYRSGKVASGTFCGEGGTSCTECLEDGGRLASPALSRSTDVRSREVRSTEVRNEASLSNVVVDGAGDEGGSLLGRRGRGGWPPRSLVGDAGGFARADGWILLAGRGGKRGVKSWGDEVPALLGGELGGTVAT